MGVLQRDEADFSCLMHRPDGLVGEPIKFGPPVMANDGILIVKRTPPIVMRSDIVTAFTNCFDAMTWYSSMIAIVIIAIVIAAATLLLQRRKKATILSLLKLSPRHAGSALWQIFALLVDQELLYPRQMSLKMLWVPLCLAVFTGMNMFTNMLVTDSFTIRPPPMIRSLDDYLHNPQWSHFKPVIIKNWFLYPFFAAASKGSIYNELKEKMDLYEGETVLANTHKEENMAKINISGIYSQDVVAIYGEDFWFVSNLPTVSFHCYSFILQKLVKPLGCRVSSDVNFDEQTYVAQERFAHGMLATYYNKRVKQRTYSSVKITWTQKLAYLLSQLWRNCSSTEFGTFSSSGLSTQYRNMSRQFYWKWSDKKATGQRKP